MSFATDLENAALPEIIQKIVIGKRLWDGSPVIKDYDFIPFNKVMDWEMARPFLDFKYDSGYGSVDCLPVCAWTKTKVLFVEDYDGLTSIGSVPRNPEDTDPSFHGGGG